LIELMVTLAVGLLLTGWVVLSVQDLLEKQRLAAGVEAVQSQLRFAKSEAGKRSQELAVRVTPWAEGTTWVIGISDDQGLCFGCNPDVCTLAYRNEDGSLVVPGRVQAISGADHPGVQVAAVIDPPQSENVPCAGAIPAASLVFDRVRGTVNAGTFTVRTSRYSATIDMNATGQLAICSPDLGRYPACTP
jgi:hypothetical protein